MTELLIADSVTEGVPGPRRHQRGPRSHQTEALNSLAAVLDSVPRAQLVMSCGTGKTLVGRWHAERIGAAVTAVVVPSLSLIAQTLAEWRSVPGWPFEALITCSDRTTADGEYERAAGDGQDVSASYWASLRARVTTESAIVASRLRDHSPSRPLVVFSTYHSVHVVADAARRAGVVMDLVVADEAHTLAGRPRPEFRIVLEEKLPARTRVFMTATQVLAETEPHSEYFEDWSAPLSMSDEKLFGPVAYRLDFSAAIARDLLSDYRVLVYEASGENLTPDPVSALLAGAREGIGKVLSFHGRVGKARAFAAAIDGITLPDGRTVVARSVAGKDPTRQRMQALELLRSARPEQMVVVCSARCLAAGVDIPAVDGVLFADPKNSDVDVIQAVGRALRKSPGKSHGVIMIPVCIPRELDEDTALSTGAFSAVWRVLRGLRAMDDRLARELDEVLRSPSRRGIRDGSRLLSHIEFNVPSITDVSLLNNKIVDFLSPAWDLFYTELEQFVAEHGHARPERNTKLGRWCERQRMMYRTGMLIDDRRARLRALPGWTWDVAEQRWIEQWAQVADLFRRHGESLLTDPELAAIPIDAKVLSRKCRASTVGRWCAWNRQLARRGDLSDWQADKLNEVDSWAWALITETDAAAVDLLGEYVAWKGHANPRPDVVEDDIELGRWLNEIRRQRVTGRLSQPLLDEIEMVTPADSAGGALRWYRVEMQWLLGIEALRQFRAREGHLRIPEKHTEALPDTTIPLYDWCTRQRYFYRHGQMPPARAQALERVDGWLWERQPAPRVLMDIGDARHGTRTGYVKGCKCEECTEANRTKARERIARSVAGRPTTDWVSATRARMHLAALDAQGAQQKSLARASKLNVKTIVGVLSGTTKRILPETETAILALTFGAVQAAVAPGTSIDGGPTWVLLDDLIARGWPKAWIAREIGKGTEKSLQLRRDSVTAGHAKAVARLYERLGDRKPQSWRRCKQLPTLDEILAESPNEPTQPALVVAPGSGTSEDSGNQNRWANQLLDQGYSVQHIAKRCAMTEAQVKSLTVTDRRMTA